MQTTLLGLAIGLILALATALVGPYFVNWSDHRNYFEAEASRLIGLDVRVGGPIDVRLLPFPSMTLSGIEVRDAGEARRLRARSLGLELDLGQLMRGEIRATEMRLVGPQVDLRLDADGRIDWPSMAIASDALSIQRLSVEDGRAILSDAGSGRSLVLDRLWFTGAVRSLAGPVRGEGAFVIDGGLYGYRVSAARADDRMRFRLVVDTSDQPMHLDAEGAISIEQGRPRLESTVTMSRPAGAIRASGAAVVTEPWVLNGRLRATPTSALFDQMSFQYGAEERAARLTGVAEIRLGASPRLQGALSARQIDLDRLIATAERPRRLPFAAIQGFAEMFGGALQAPMPASIAISIDTVMLGGATLQSVGGDLRFDGDGWRLDKFEFRAPGFTQVSLSGRLGNDPRSLGFSGDASVEANDPKALVAWLVGRSGVPIQIKPWQARGAITLDANRIAVERLKTEFERGTIEGRLTYLWPTAERPARLDADLAATELDFDALAEFGNDAMAGLDLSWPREIALSLDAQRGRFAGFDVRRASTKLQIDADGIAIDRLSVADFGHANIQASGRIRTADAKGGNIVLDIDAGNLVSVVALAERFAPTLVRPLQHIGASDNGGAKLRVSLGLDQKEGGKARAMLRLEGRLGALQVDASGEANGVAGDFAAEGFTGLTAADARFETRFDTEDSATLLALLGLDRFAVAQANPGVLRLSGAGRPKKGLTLESRLAAGAVEVEARGILRFEGGGAVLRLERVEGAVAKRAVSGKLDIVFGENVRIDGEVQAASVDAPALIAAAAGVRSSDPASADGWSHEPFARSVSPLGGRIAFAAETAALGAGLRARNLKGVAHFNATQVSLENVTGEIGGGRLNLALNLTSRPGGLAAKTTLSLSDVGAGAMLPGRLPPPVAGRLTMHAELEGEGLSPAAFVGSLSGSGSIRLEDGRLAGLNPHVFDAVSRAVDLGVSSDTARIREFAASALDAGTLNLQRASAEIAVNAGQARLSDVAIKAQGVELTLTANVSMANAGMDALLELRGRETAAGEFRPTVFIALHGPLTEPKRSVDANLLASWLALRAVEEQTRRIEALEKLHKELMMKPEPAAARPRADEAGLPDTRPAGMPVVMPPPEPTLPGSIMAPPLPPAVEIAPSRAPASRPAPLAPRAETRPANPRASGASPGAPLDLLELLGAKN